jgi:hypothetical protein
MTIKRNLMTKTFLLRLENVFIIHALNLSVTDLDLDYFRRCKSLFISYFGISMN